LDLIKDFIKEGGNVNVPDIDGQTPLDIVSAFGYKNIKKNLCIIPLLNYMNKSLWIMFLNLVE